MMSGLTSHRAQSSLAKYGLNILPQKKGVSALKIFLRQLQNPLSILLVGAIILSALIGDQLDIFLIGAILVLNTLLGFWQEYKASRELEALAKLQVEFARVKRDGKQIKIPSAEIVPGDLLVLESGDRILADGKVVEGFSLQVNESVLTGESLPVAKSTKQEENLVFFGTTAVSGRALVEVLQTGVKTKFGSIAESLATIEEEKTPFEKSLITLSKGLGLVAILVAVIIFGLGVFNGHDIPQLVLTSIALMVAVVPEGLPTVVTIVLALGVRKMYRQKALVRKMIAVESLGGVTVICTDKTGTLTKNQMKVQEVKLQEKKEDL
ncbi:HAD-IC family P-type ATPase, partial [Candidatus Daviesbacteria bacterium]|nr:HAD-IC family P-type ATPase [Candidatus Daviesbacteria bacterium]